MFRNIILSLCLLASAVASNFAQPINVLVKNGTLPSPNAAALGKYTDISVSYLTGVPNIGVPIHTIAHGPLAVPISLSYHSSGIKLAETASWVGLGWSLQAGGMVTRQVAGQADDLGSTGYYSGYSTAMENLFSPLISPNWYINYRTCNGISPCAETIPEDQYTQMAGNIETGVVDGEPDIFSFNFAGYSGKFVFDKNKNVVLIPKQDLIVEVSPSNGGVFTRISIITPDGTKYHFGNTPGGSLNFTEKTYPSLENVPAYYSTWYLARIDSYDSKFQINFNYATEQTDYRQPGNCTYSIANTPNNGGQAIDCIGGFEDAYHPFQAMTTQGQRLTQISTPSETVTFIANTTREDVGFAKRLDEIQISTGISPNIFQKKFSFSFDYITDGTSFTNAERKRLRLTQLQEKSVDNAATTTVPPYTFTYNGNTLPYRLSRAVDHWGFHNGATANEAQIGPNVPPISYSWGGSPTSYGGANRESNEAAMKTGMLTKITYPTGGFTEFELEGNTVPQYVQGPNTLNYFGGTPVQNCTSTSTALCCGNQNFNHNTSFTATQLSDGKMRLLLYPLSPSPGSTGCVLPYTNASFYVHIYNNVTNAYITSRGFGMSRTDMTGMPSKDSLIFNLSDLGLQNSVTYRFNVILTNGRGELAFFTTAPGNGSYTAKVVGGLRIKQIRMHDGISTANDVYKSYKYVDELDPNKSSGVLRTQPKYGEAVVYGGFTTFTAAAMSIVPLGDFDGYHIGYRRIVEQYNAVGAPLANGQTIYRYKFSPYYASGLPLLGSNYYSAPMLYENSIGFNESATLQNNGSTTVSSVTNALNLENYQTNAGMNIRIRKLKVFEGLSSAGNGQPYYSGLYFITNYTIRTSLAARIQSITETRDGVTTTTNYTYDAANRFLAPTITNMTNSNGVTTNTRMTTVYDMAAGALRTKLLNLNMIAAPIKTLVYVGADTIDGTRMDYSLYDAASGQPTTTDASNHFPYPWQHYRYEANVNPNGTINGTPAWVLKGTQNRIYVASGLPWEFTMANWPVETYEWETNGLVKKRTYQNFVWEYNYFTNTRLVSSIKNIDGQIVNYTYDQLQRLKTANARSGNVVTTYDYQYRTSSYLYNTVKSTTAFSAVGSSSLTSKATAQLLDGLGRPVQDIKIQHNPTKGADGATSSAVDVVTNYIYDTQGRLAQTSLPFTSNNTNGTYFAPPSGTKYGVTAYEASPLNRPLSVTPPDWYATTSAYGTNAANEVLIAGSSSFYAAGLLYKTTTTDPDNRVSITFIDRKGRVVLKRQTNTSNTTPADTYYAYDNKDRLVRVIPPGASTTNPDLVFAYQYDARDRMTRKKVPDMGSISMRYNLRDQLVFVQDSMQAGLIRCLGTKYDVYGRPIESGFVAGFPTDPEAAFSFFESLTQTHYDGFDGSSTLNLTTNPQYRGKVRRSLTKVMGTTDWLNSTFDYDTHGRTTAVNTNNHLNPTVFTAEQISMSYDWADNVVYENRNHNPGAAGATGSFSVQNTITFDHAGRRTNFITTIGGVGAHIAEYNYNHRDELIEKNLHSNQVASVWGWLQSVDYSYNAQGWLTGINTYANSATVGVPALCSPSMPNPATPTRTQYNETSDAFYMDIRYDNTFGGVSGSIQKAGNIAQLAYRVRGRETHIYSYAYDYLNRLTSATFNEYSDAGSITNSNKYNESLTYDLRGNIQTLQRTGYYQDGATCTYGQIDNLTYTYTINTNRVHRIQDAVTTTGATARGFNPNGQGATNDAMTYDRNGNLNKNNYKNVSAITYNHLNLPTLITFNTGNSIEFLYDAVGTKLRKTVKVGATVQYVQDYLSGGIEYRQNGTGVKRVESVFHVEGRYYNTNVDASNTLAWRREYNIKDHLGNTRVVISDRNANGVLDITSTASTSDVLQENHYYAFGLGFEGPWVQNDAASRDNKYQYNGKELNDDFGLNWSDYGARWYDAAIGRWGGVDLLSSKFSSWSPYNYVLCNPMQNTDPDGKDVIVNRDGNHISISYRGALIDESGQLTKKAVRQIRREITSNLKKIFTGAGDGITFGIDVQLRQVSSSSKLKENENSVTLVNSKDKRLPEGFSGYAPNGFDALVNVEGKNISGIAKTATHEIGHNFGLPHNVHDFTSKGFEKLPFGESMEVFKYLEANIIQQGHPAAGNLMLPGNQETAAGMNITPSQILHIYQDSDSGKLNSRNISGSSDKWGTYSSDRPVVNAYGKVIKE